MSGRLLGSLVVTCVAVAVAGGLLWFVRAAPAFAQDAPEKKNCPAGFHWERYPSPIGCVQTQLPANARIGYDGYGICDAGYVGDYERRATTDGKPAPGSPYTSFPYLHRCFTAKEYEELKAAGQLPSQMSSGSSSGSGFSPGGSGPVSDAAEELYDGGGAPSDGQLAVLGVGVGTGFGLWSWGTFVLGSSPIGAGVFGGRRDGAAGSRRTASAEYAKQRDLLLREKLTEQALERFRRRREAALREWRRIGDAVIRFRMEWYGKQIPRQALIGLFAVLTVKWMPVALALKILLGIGVHTFTAMNSSWPPVPEEAGRMLKKLEPQLLRAKQQYLEADAWCHRMENQLAEIQQELYKLPR